MHASVLPAAVKIPVTKPCFGPEEELAVAESLRSGWVAQGPRVAEFERRFAEYVGAQEAVALSSCTTALHLALIGAGVGEGDEVICPSLSFIATANVIMHVGARPVFVDVAPGGVNIDSSKIREAMTSRTRAILAVHQIGEPAEMDEINQVASEHRVAVIEDAACAIGSEYKDTRIGAPHSSLACFSFHPRKLLVTGEGGMITTSDSVVAARLRRLRQHAMSISDLARHGSEKVITESYDEVGYNYRMTDLQAAIGLVQLGRLEGFLERRRYLAARYTKALSGLDWLIAPDAGKHGKTNFQSYMARVVEHGPISRDDLMQHLLRHGVSTRRGIMAIHREKPYQSFALDESLPNTCIAADRGIILPLFHQMEEGEQDYVIDCIASI